jgi:hypothetical protein
VCWQQTVRCTILQLGVRHRPPVHPNERTRPLGTALCLLCFPSLAALCRVICATVSRVFTLIVALDSVNSTYDYSALLQAAVRDVAVQIYDTTRINIDVEYPEGVHPVIELDTHPVVASAHYHEDASITSLKDDVCMLQNHPDALITCLYVGCSR